MSMDKIHSRDPAGMRKFDVTIRDTGKHGGILTGHRLVSRKIIDDSGNTSEEPITEEFMFGADILKENSINPTDLSPGDVVRFSVTDGEDMGGAIDEDGMVLSAQIVRDND